MPERDLAGVSGRYRRRHVRNLLHILDVIRCSTSRSASHIATHRMVSSRTQPLMCACSSTLGRRTSKGTSFSTWPGRWCIVQRRRSESYFSAFRVRVTSCNAQSRGYFAGGIFPNFPSQCLPMHGTIWTQYFPKRVVNSISQHIAAHRNVSQQMLLRNVAVHVLCF